jgi:hypothetical protein
MEVSIILRSGFSLANQRLRMLVLDLLWKIAHGISVFVLIAAAAAWLIQNLAQYKWEGPELTPSNPILLGMALAEVWKTYSGTLAWTVVGVAAGTIILWIVLEALFRGGIQRFWKYAATRVAFLSVVVSAGMVLMALTAREGLQTGIASAIILLAIWWIASTAETLVRRDAMDLLAMDLPGVSGAMASLLGFQLLFSTAAIAVLGLSIRLIFRASSPLPFLAAACLMLATVVFWTIVHSYLVVVRYSTIDIMRANVVEA